MKKLGILLLVVAVAAVAAALYVSDINDFERDAERRIATLEHPVRVVRDELGVPYIFAQNTPDLVRAQGFVTAQHRLFQLEAYRAIFNGELAAAIGERGLSSDIRMRLFGVRRNAVRHASVLSDETRAYLAWFVEGINAYVEGYPEEHHFEFTVSPFRVGTWSVEDIVSIVHYVHHRQAVNYKMELIVAQLIDRVGAERTREILPLNMNPDRIQTARPVDLAVRAATPLGVAWRDLILGRESPDDNGFGSNNWVVGPKKSASGYPILANDPHLDSRILPGIWHPIGLFTPDIKAVGAALPGLPGILVGRSEHVAFGVTNSYGDVQDLYIETVDPTDPARYLDGSNSRAFRTRLETIRIRDDNAPGGFREHRLTIRSTRRGPVISDHGLGAGGDNLIVVRTTAAEISSPVLGIEQLLEVGSAAQFDAELAKIDLLMFNFVFADDQGHIGQRASGAIPSRLPGHGASARHPPADGSDDWPGYIPKSEMPGRADPARGWLGTANHDVRPDGYPYYYSSFFSPSYRYRRIRSVLNSARTTTVTDHWQLIHDARNLQSDRMRGLFVRVLGEHHRYVGLAATLEAWDGVDATDSAAPLIYQSIYEQFAIATFADELGTTLSGDLLSAGYFWQERLDAMVADGESRWFDDITTPGQVESMIDLIGIAASRAVATLSARFGDDATKWRWGDAHTVTFVSPLRRSGFGRDFLGAGEFPLAGSRDTLRRGRYAFGTGFEARGIDSLRVVVDLGDADKITAVVPGGVVGRQFHEHQANQVDPWVRGEMRHWWFSRAAIEEHARHVQWLVP